MNELRKKYISESGGKIKQTYLHSEELICFKDEYVYWLEEKLKALSIAVVGKALPSEVMKEAYRIANKGWFKDFENYLKQNLGKSDLLACECPVYGEEVTSQLIKHHRCKKMQ